MLQQSLESRLPLFVYGTLRPGTPGFATYLEGATLSVRPATVRGRLWLHAGEEYPFLTAGEEEIHGELIEVEDAAWERIMAALDKYEEYAPEDEAGSCYLRRRIAASPDDGTTVTAWTYLWNRPPAAGIPIPGGDWQRR
jgi:gamma-glutamylcyclotransferase (GGCT)/AIG2-like uncharacterized protein YtfP